MRGRTVQAGAATQRGASKRISAALRALQWTACIHMGALRLALPSLLTAPCSSLVAAVMPAASSAPASSACSSASTAGAEAPGSASSRACARCSACKGQGREVARTGGAWLAASSGGAADPTRRLCSRRCAPCPPPQRPPAAADRPHLRWLRHTASASLLPCRPPSAPRRRPLPPAALPPPPRPWCSARCLFKAAAPQLLHPLSPARVQLALQRERLNCRGVPPAAAPAGCWPMNPPRCYGPFLRRCCGL